MVSCSIHCLHWAVVTPTLLPHSTETGPRGWLFAILTTSSIEISSTVYTATTSRANGRVFTAIFGNFFEEVCTWSISFWHKVEDTWLLVNLKKENNGTLVSDFLSTINNQRYTSLRKGCNFPCLTYLGTCELFGGQILSRTQSFWSNF